MDVVTLGLAKADAKKNYAPLAKAKFSPSKRFQAMATAAVMGTPPTITDSGTTSGIAGTKAFVNAQDARLRYLNGPMLYSGSKMRVADVLPNENRTGIPAFDMDFMFDGTVFEINCMNDAAATLRVWVDGQPSAAAPAVLPGTNDGTAGHYYKVTLAAGTRGIPRHIRVEGDVLQLIQLAISAVDQITAAEDPVTPLVCLVGDSYGAGFGFVAGSTTTQGSKTQGYARHLQLLMGWPRLWNGLTLSGSGYLASAQTYRPRITADLPAAADLVIIQGSINDGGNTSAAVQTEAALTIAAARAKAPNAQVIVTGPLYMGNYPGAGGTVIAPGISAAATAAGIPFIDASAWFNGTGKDTATTGDGPADWAMSSDGTHPTAAGHRALARNLARELRRTLSVAPVA